MKRKSKGSIIIPAGLDIWKHELRTAQVFARSSMSPPQGFFFIWYTSAMGYHLEINSLLVVSSELLDLKTIKAGETHHIVKEGERLYPLNIPIPICDENYQHYGKVTVRKLTLEAGKTSLEIEVLKIFSAAEAAAYTNTFIKL